MIDTRVTVLAIHPPTRNHNARLPVFIHTSHDHGHRWKYLFQFTNHRIITVATGFDAVQIVVLFVVTGGLRRFTSESRRRSHRHRRGLNFIVTSHRDRVVLK